ncbi:MAG TPA: HPF/RaiA family ribosome-associated protein [Pirellulales bacterium]|nr:HPF/RaiA family ribosome-associated protein [Pirellulales bacterium]
MKIEVSSDAPITETVLKEVAAEIESGLERFQDRLTRAEAHLKHVAGAPPGGSRSCSLEIRPAGREPVVVSGQASTLEEAVKGAVEKMYRLLNSMFGKLDSKTGGPSASGLRT